MSILAANPCRSKAPTLWTIDSLDDFDRIKQPNIGDIALLVGDGVTQFWVFESPVTEDIDGYDLIAGGCQGAWVIAGDVINMIALGAVGDNLTDNTDVVDEAVARLAARGGGMLYFPFARDRYLFNTVIDVNNIVIVGSGVRDVRTNTRIGFAPYDTSKPVIQVGNNTGIVQGFSIRDVAIFGERNGTHCPGCLHFLGGAWGSVVSDIGMISGDRTLYFKAGTLFPSTLNSVTKFETWEGQTSTVEVDDTRSADPNSFCTGTKLVSGYINGANAAGNAIKCIRGKLNMEGVYMDANSPHGIYLETGGNISAYNCDLEVESTTAVLVEVNFPLEVAYTERSIARFIQGGARMQGKVKWTDQSGSVETTLPILEFTANEPDLRKPYIELPSKLGDVAVPFGIFLLDHENPDIVLSRIDLAAPRFRLGSNEAYLLFGLDNTSIGQFFVDNLKANTVATQFELWRSTNTTGDSVLIIYKGDGTASANTRLSGKATSYINAITGNVGIGTVSPDASAKLEVASNGSGFLPPRMTQAQRDAIAAPANGLMIFNVDTDKLQVRAAGVWDDLN